MNYIDTFKKRYSTIKNPCSFETYFNYKQPNNNNLNNIITLQKALIKDLNSNNFLLKNNNKKEKTKTFKYYKSNKNNDSILDSIKKIKLLNK